MKEIMGEQLDSVDQGGASVARDGIAAEKAEAKGFYEVVCYGPDGKEKWRDTIENVVTTLGANYILDNALAGSTYTAALYIGLIDNSGSTFLAADTMASQDRKSVV